LIDDRNCIASRRLLYRIESDFRGYLCICQYCKKGFSDLLSGKSFFEVFHIFRKVVMLANRIIEHFQYAECLRELPVIARQGLKELLDLLVQ
jgi:hypothetical protein